MSPACRQNGLCTFFADKCVAMDAEDCSRSAACRQAGACRAEGGHCVSTPDPASFATKVRSKGSIGAGVSLLIAGTILTVVGGSVGFGGEEDEHLTAGLIFTGIGGSMIVTGVPLTALGATEIPYNSHARSIPAMAGGTFLAGALGGSAVVGGGILAGLGEAVGLLPICLGTGVMVGGVALGWHGATAVPDELPSTLGVNLHVGPGTVSATGTF